MASPFAFFRKNQQSMMVVLVIMAMLVFTLDSVFSSRDNQFVVLGMLLGGTIFAIAGISRRRWMHYGLAGAILGALSGWLMPMWLMSAIDRPSAIASTLGVFDDRRIGDLQLQRGIANQFLYRVTEAAIGEGAGPYGARFGFGHESERDDVVFGELMRSEADDLGIVVTNEMVSAYINSVTDNKLTRQAFAKVRSELTVDGQKLSDETLFDILREEVRAQLAFQTLHPQNSLIYQAPEVAWAMFRRLNVSQKLNTAMIDIDAFLDQVPEPSDGEAGDFFNQHRLKMPNADGPGSFGFRQPRKTKLAWLEVSYDTIERTVTPVTDEEVEVYYEENRDILYRRPVAPDVPEAPTAPDPDTPTPDTPTPDDPTPDDPTPDTPTPDTPTPDTPTPDTPTPDTPTPDDPTPDTPTPDDPTPDTPTPDPGTECGFPDEQENTANGDEPQPQAAAAADEPRSQASDEPVQPAAEVQEPLQIPALTIDPEAGQAEPSEEPQFPEQQYEIRPLDDDLRGSIRDQLLARRVREAIETRMTEILSEMQRLESDRRSQRLKLKEQYSKLDDRSFALRIAEYSPTIIAGTKKLAAAAGAEYVETPFVSVEDLFRSESYPIGRAIPPGGNPMNPGADVVTTVFSVPGDELQFFRPRRAVRSAFDLDAGETHYAWWIIDDSPAHVPTLEEPGIREEVVLAWKRIKARELARTRAETLAEQVRQGLMTPDEDKRPMASVLDNVSTTGREDSPGIVVRQTERFAWMQQPARTQMSFGSVPVLSTIRFVGDGMDTLQLAFDDFMKAVFEELQNDEVGVVPNADLSKLYIVQIVDRTPSAESGEDALRQRFLAESGRGLRQTPLLRMIQDRVVMPGVAEWSNALWLKYGVDRSLIPDVDERN